MVKIEVCPFCDEMAMIYIYDNTKDGIEYCKCVKCGKTWETKEQFLKNEKIRKDIIKK